MIASLPTQERVDEVARKLAPDVVRIRLNIATDWSEYPAFYFKVTLSDDASRLDRLRSVTGKVRQTVADELGLEAFEHFPYFRFRSQSEQAELKDKSWE